MRYERTIFGNKAATKSLIAYLIENGLKPDLAVTLGAAARGGVEIAGGSDDLASWCSERGIRTYECESYKLSSDADRRFFAENSFGIGVSTGWQRLIPAEVLDRFDAGVFGFHGSMMRLPNGRGRSPLNWSLRLDADRVFHNCFRYAAGADDGAVFNTTELPIHPRDTIRILQFKALADIKITTGRLLTQHADGALKLLDQPGGASIWLPKLTPADSLLEFGSMPIDQALAIIRASSRPFAGAVGQIADTDDQIILWDALPYEGPRADAWNDAAVGTVLDTAEGLVLVKCIGGELLATDLSIQAEKLAGRRLR